MKAMACLEIVFFFSSRRRHTRLQGDWSSDVCSSDLGFGPAIVSHYDNQPIIDIFGAAQDRDLGAVNEDIRAQIAALEGKLPKGTHIEVRGQIQTMAASYSGLAIGFVGAILLVYLLIVINFQSWLGPFIIITPLPAAVAGIGWEVLGSGDALGCAAPTGGNIV